MAVSVGVKTRSLEKIVLPADADRTTVVLAQELAVGERSNFKKIPTHTQDHGDA